MERSYLSPDGCAGTIPFYVYRRMHLNCSQWLLETENAMFTRTRRVIPTYELITYIMSCHTTAAYAPRVLSNLIGAWPVFHLRISWCMIVLSISSTIP